MNIISFFTARPNNSKGNSFNLSKKNKINNWKTDIIINNIAKTKKNNNSNFLDGKGDPKRENKRERKLYNKKNNNKNRKIQIAKLNKYHEKRKKFKF